MRRCTLRSTRVARDRGARFRIPAAIALLALGSLALAGCAADPDVTDLETQLSEVDGVNDATVSVTHSNGPWETQLVVTLFIEDATEDGVVDVARAAAPVFVADPAGSRHDVSIYFVPGQQSDYDSEFDAQGQEVPVTADVAAALGVPDTGPYSLRLSPAQMRAIADGE